MSAKFARQYALNVAVALDTIGLQHCNHTSGAQFPARDAKLAFALADRIRDERMTPMMILMEASNQNTTRAFTRLARLMHAAIERNEQAEREEHANRIG